MLKKKIPLAVFSLFCCVGCLFAKSDKTVDGQLAAVPLPTLSAAEALDIAKELKRNPPHAYHWAGSDNYTVVAIDWCKSSDFRPRFSDGSNWLVRDDQDAYAWFVTYLEAPHGPSPIRSVGIIRIKNNGKADFMVGIRT
jgi:hypothetical protein